MIDVSTEDLTTLAIATGLVPGRSGRGVAMATIWRWVLRGVRGVRLESILIGGTRYTSRQALARFIAATNAASAAPPVVEQSSSQRVAEAERELSQILGTCRSSTRTARGPGSRQAASPDGPDVDSS